MEKQNPELLVNALSESIRSKDKKALSKALVDFVLAFYPDPSVEEQCLWCRQSVEPQLNGNPYGRNVNLATTGADRLLSAAE